MLEGMKLFLVERWSPSLRLAFQRERRAQEARLSLQSKAARQSLAAQERLVTARLAAAQEELQKVKKSIAYRQADFMHLIEQGFVLEKNKNTWKKVEHFNYGQYPGEYTVKLWFPEDYPSAPPRVYAYPEFEGEYSEHIMDTHEVCIQDKDSHSSRLNNYWKEGMNARGALRLAYHVISGELEHASAKKEVRPESIQGTVFADLRKVVSKREFLRYARKHHFAQVNPSWTWEHIAAEYQGTSRETKQALVKYLRERQEVKV